MTFVRRHAGKLAAGGIVAGLTITASVIENAPAIIHGAATVIHQFEGGRAADGSAVAYVDHAGRGEPPTACEGLTGPDIHAGQRYTRAQCDEMLSHGLAVRLPLVEGCLHPPRPMSVNTYAASLTLAFNIGTPAFCSSTIVRRFNAGDFHGACAGFSAWNKGTVHGRRQVLRGLVRRRAAERALCLSGLS